MTQAEKPHRGVKSPADRLRDLADDFAESVSAIAAELAAAPSTSARAEQLRGIAGFVATLGGTPNSMQQMLREMLQLAFHHKSHPKSLRDLAERRAALPTWIVALRAEAARLDGADRVEGGVRLPSTGEHIAAAARAGGDDDPLPMRLLVNLLEAMATTPAYYDIRASLKDLVRRQRKDCPSHDGCIHADDLFKVVELIEGRRATLATTSPGAKALAAVEVLKQNRVVEDFVAARSGVDPLTTLASVRELARKHRGLLQSAKQVEERLREFAGLDMTAHRRRQLHLIADILAHACAAAESEEEHEEPHAAESAGTPPPCAVFRPEQRAEVLKLLDGAAELLDELAEKGPYQSPYGSVFRQLIAAIRKIVTPPDENV